MWDPFQMAFLWLVKYYKGGLLTNYVLTGMILQVEFPQSNVAEKEDS